jgi:hypothetical protein
MHEDEQDRRLKRLPICCKCEHPIQDAFLFNVDDELYCKECAEDEFEKPVEDYMED